MEKIHELHGHIWDLPDPFSVEDCPRWNSGCRNEDSCDVCGEFVYIKTTTCLHCKAERKVEEWYRIEKE
jgi:hypothetical protein